MCNVSGFVMRWCAHPRDELEGFVHEEDRRDVLVVLREHVHQGPEGVHELAPFLPVVAAAALIVCVRTLLGHVRAHGHQQPAPVVELVLAVHVQGPQAAVERHQLHDPPHLHLAREHHRVYRRVYVRVVHGDRVSRVLLHVLHVSGQGVLLCPLPQLDDVLDLRIGPSPASELGCPLVNWQLVRCTCATTSTTCTRSPVVHNDA